MKSKSTKRIENKKKKMVALLEISKLNENDRKDKKPHKNDDEAEPSRKRPRTNNNEETIKDEDVELGPSGKPKLSGAEFKELKKQLRERVRFLKARPAFRLRDMGTSASLATQIENRTPLFVSDIQHLIMYSQMGPLAPYHPAKWCAIDKVHGLKATAVLIVENHSLDDYLNNSSSYEYLGETFTNKLEILPPDLFKSDVVHDLSMVPLTGTQMKKLILKYGNLNMAYKNSNEIFDRLRSVFPIDNKEAEVDNKSLNKAGLNTALPPSDVFPRTELLLSGWQMIEENFPMPILGICDRKYPGYVLTKDKYEPVTPFSRMYGVDCEMCRTEVSDSELTRVSVVDEDLNTCYDKLVKPDSKIIDYLTQYSGITKEMMRNVTTTLEDVHADLRRLLPPDAILVGQSLSNDMHALKMMHPYIIDTSVIFNVTGDRTRKTKLKVLSEEFLDEKIQQGSEGHCSTEDSLASLKLAQLKLKKSLFFGDAVMGNVYNDVRKDSDIGTLNYGTSLLRQTTRMSDNSATIVGVAKTMGRYNYYLRKGNGGELEANKKLRRFTEAGNEEVVERVCREVGRGGLTVGHVDLEGCCGDQDLNGEIGGWVKRVYEAMPWNGLVIVLFSGSNGKNGACFIECKQEDYNNRKLLQK